MGAATTVSERSHTTKSSQQVTWMRTSMSESRETVFRHASGGGLRSALGSREPDSFVHVPIAKQR